MLPAPLHPLHQHPRWEFRRRRSQHFLPCGLLSNPAPYVPCLCCETAGCSSGMNGSLHHSREGCKMCLCSRGAAKPASASCWAVRSDLVQAAQCPLSRWPRYLDCLLFGKFVQGLLDLHSIPSFTPQLFWGGTGFRGKGRRAPALGRLVVDGRDKPMKRGMTQRSSYFSRWQVNVISMHKQW